MGEYVLVPMPEPVGPRLFPAHKEDRWLVSVDLGKTKVGVARWWVTADDASLAQACTLDLPKGTEPWSVAESVVKKVTQDATGDFTWVCEWPMKYPTKRKFHEDIDALHAVGNALQAHIGKWSKKFRPGEWKGNVPKSAHHTRLRAALGTLDVPVEEHDTWDAIGIGAYALGLTKRGAVR